MKDKIYKLLTGILIFAGGGILNYFGSNPRILYFPALALCAWLTWIILSGVHSYIARVEQAQSPAAQQVASSGEESLPTVRFFSEKPSAYIIRVGTTQVQILPNGNVYPVLGIGRFPDGRLGVQCGGDQVTSETVVRAQVEDGVLRVDADLYSGDASKPMRLVNFVLENKPSGWDRNFVENRAQEVTNSENKPVFQIVYNDLSTATLSGIFASGKEILLASTNAITLIPSGAPVPFVFKPIFKHPWSMYAGEFSESAEAAVAASQPGRSRSGAGNGGSVLMSSQDQPIEQQGPPLPPRVITQQQRERFKDELNSLEKNEAIALFAPADDAEAVAFGKQIKEMLINAGFNSIKASTVRSDPPDRSKGLTFIVQDPSHLSEMQEAMFMALQHAGVRPIMARTDSIDPLTADMVRDALNNSSAGVAISVGKDSFDSGPTK